jgi:hypothetical protein
MSKSLRWIFYDSMSKTQSNAITLDEAQMALFKMRPRDWSRFYIWTQSWDCWQPLDLFLKSEQRYFVTQFSSYTPDDTVKYQTIRDVLEMSQVTEKTHKEITKSFSGVAIHDDSTPNQEPHLGKSAFDGDDLSWDNAKKSELNFKKLTEKIKYNKRSARMNLKIEILLISSKGTIFKSASKNISLSGSLLEDNIPFDYYGVVFDVVIVNRISQGAVNARVKLKAATVGEGLTQRISFHEATATDKKSLHGLLQDYLDNQSILDKKIG